MWGIITAILAWVVMLIVGTNLVGFVVRCFIDFLFFSTPHVDMPVDEVGESTENFGAPADGAVEDLIASEYRKMRVGNLTMAVVFLGLTGGYFFSLYHFWNIGLVAAAGLLMMSRLPDLLWEIRTGKKVSRVSMPKGPAFIVAVVLDLVALPLTWYSLCLW
jgi:hypothetical protein